MIHIDLPCDLNMIDDDGLNVALLREAVHPDRVSQGAVMVVGHPSFWSWASIDGVDDGVITLHQITMTEAARRTQLVSSDA